MSSPTDMASPATAGSNLRAQTQQISLYDPQKEVKQEEKQEVKQETKNRKWYMCRKVFTENEFECFCYHYRGCSRIICDPCAEEYGIEIKVFDGINSEYEKKHEDE